MVLRPMVLCPVDFSDASRGALRYAAVLAEHFFAAMTVLRVDDPLFVQTGAASYGAGYVERQTHDELDRFVRRAFPGRTPQIADLRVRQATGGAGGEILRIATEIHADIIVMSTHGTSGFRTAKVGSTTERVLQSTHLPVLVTPAGDPGPESLEDWQRDLNVLLVPVDFSASTARQLQIAVGLAEALDTPLLLVHVVEPESTAGSGKRDVVDGAARNTEAAAQLERLGARLGLPVRPAVITAQGDPATQIARIARERRAGAIVMALHSGPASHRRVGAVAYQLLCQTPSLVIAWPPSHPETRLTPDPARHSKAFAR